MKSERKKLKVKREIVRTLSSDDMQEVAGGSVIVQRSALNPELCHRGPYPQ